MTTRPLLLRDHEVRAVLDGSKTQHRVPVKVPRDLRTHQVSFETAWADPGLGGGGYLKLPHLHPEDAPCPVEKWAVERVRCPLGEVGDRLRVREACKALEADTIAGVWYPADGSWRPIQNTKEAADLWLALRAAGNTVPSTNMPRWASRITLEITAVRVQRLHDITEEDARAEGVVTWASQNEGFQKLKAAGIAVPDRPQFLLQLLWTTKNGSEAWASNPWVWAVTFKRVSS